MKYAIRNAAAAAGLFLLLNANSVSSIAKQDGNWARTTKKQELALPQSVKMQFAREKGRLERALSDSLELKDGKLVIPADTNYKGTVIIIDPADSTASQDSSRITSAKDSTIAKKKLRRAYNNVLEVNVDDFLSLSPQDSLAYVDSLHARMNRVLPHKKYKNDKLETYQEWSGRLADFLRRLEAFDKYFSEGEKKEASVYPDSLKGDSLEMAKLDSINSRLMPWDRVDRVVRALSEYDHGGRDDDYKRKAALSFFMDYGKAVGLLDAGLIEGRHSSEIESIERIYYEVHDSVYRKPKKPSSLVLFTEVAMHLAYDRCTETLDDSYPMGVMRVDRETRKKLIAEGVKGMLAALFEGSELSLLALKRGHCILSKEALYELKTPKKERENDAKGKE